MTIDRNTDPHASFRKLIADDPVMLERWQSLVTEATQYAKEKFGVGDITGEELMTLSAARMRAVTGDPDFDYREEMAQGLAKIRRVQESRQMREAISKEDSEAAENYLAGLTPLEKMQWARSGGAQNFTDNGDDIPKTPEAKAAAISKINKLSSPGMRMAEYRRLGLDK